MAAHAQMGVLVLGGSGMVGTGVLAAWAGRIAVEAPSHAQLDVLDHAALRSAIQASNAAIVLNLAGWADVDGAEAQRGDEHGSVYQLNVELPAVLAETCRETSKHLVHVSTDYVFDGAQLERPYTEDDATGPLGWYARTKALGEQRLVDTGACIARIEMPFTAHAHHKADLARLCLARLQAGQAFTGVVDQRITPVYLDDAAEAFLRLASERIAGVVHVAAADWTTPYAFARGLARRLEFDLSLIQRVAFATFAQRRPAPRPQHSWLDVKKFEGLFGAGVLRSVDQALDDLAARLGARAVA